MSRILRGDVDGYVVVVVVVFTIAVTRSMIGVVVLVLVTRCQEQTALYQLNCPLHVQGLAV